MSRHNMHKANQRLLREAQRELEGKPEKSRKNWSRPQTAIAGAGKKP